jgi:hypothetical protein
VAIQKIIIYANDLIRPADAPKDDLPERTAMKRADSNTQVIGCSSIDTFVYAFKLILANPSWTANARKLEIDTHGNEGFIAVGSDRLGPNNFFRFRNLGFEKMFNRDFQIDMRGCSLAADAEGEYFLAEFAPIFLAGKGGKMSGHSSAEYSDPFLTGWGVSFGSDVTATVTVGGGVTVDGPNLNLQNLRSSLSRTQREFKEYEGKFTPGQKGLIAQKIGGAVDALGPSTTAPSYSKRYTAWHFITQANAQINLVKPNEDYPYDTLAGP